MGALYLKKGTATATEERCYATIVMGWSLEPCVLENSIFVFAAGLGRTPTSGAPVLQDIGTCLTLGTESFAASQTHHMPAQWPKKRLRPVKTYPNAERFRMTPLKEESHLQHWQHPLALGGPRISSAKGLIPVMVAKTSGVQ